ncbi:MAG: homoserine dehydrogenase [Aquificaceae bacterium]|nr:homoserine dehydrogenase [Aquificaceae bacterium]MDW8237653.1 homoserine dehydrogenase [Aquificaceae bacterium]
MRSVRVGIVGCGTVGTGVVKLLLENRAHILSRTGIDIILTKVADQDWQKARIFEVPKELRTTDYNEVLQNCDIAVELVGGTEFAKHFIQSAIKAKKHVVTANKHLIATHGQELLNLANEMGVSLSFEASVGGGIPVIKVIKEALCANRIKSVIGILNGTTNFILSCMQEGESFQNCLKKAQELGYAEKDPKFDIEGIDSAHKILILGMLAFGKLFNLSEIYIEGISNLKPIDLSLGAELGYRLKLLGIAKLYEDSVELRVHPAFLPQSELLSKVDGVFNAIKIDGDFVGEITLQGQGAGALPTASAVVSDIIDLALGRVSQVPTINSHLNLQKDFSSRYYLRLQVVDKPGVLASVAGILAKHDISIASVLQKEKACKIANSENTPFVPLVILTHRASESKMQKALSEIDLLQISNESPTLLRVEE